MKRAFAGWLLVLLLLAGPAQGERADGTLYPIRENGLWGYMNRAGETVIPPTWRQAERFHDGVAVVSNSEDGDLPQDKQCGLIDAAGRYILEPKYQVLGFYRFQEDGDGGKMAYYDPESGYLSPFFYEEIFPGGDLLIYSFEERPSAPYGFLDPATGEAVTPPIFDGLYDDVGCTEGYILAAYERGHQSNGRVWGPDYHLYTLDGEEIFFPEGIMPDSGVHSGVLAVKKELTVEEASAKGSGWGVAYGLAQADGKVILPPKFDYVSSPWTGCCGRVSFWDHELVGILDLEGNVIVPAQYKISTGGPIPEIVYHNGYAVLADSLTKREIILGLDGQEIYALPSSDEAGSYWIIGVMPGGFFWQLRLQEGKDAYTLMKIENGQAICQSEEAFEDISCNFAFCQEDGEDAFYEGLHPVKQGGLWGYINAQGKMAIAPQWDQADDFHDGLALVEKDGKLAYIDHAGETVWREK